MTTNAAESSETTPEKDTVPQTDNEEDSDEEDILEFNLFEAHSWDNQLLEEERQKEKEEENKRNQGEAHLVDGELHFDSEEHHGPKKNRNPNLVEGNTLPEDSGFPKEYYGKPMEEIDKLIKDKTFVVVAPRFKKEYIYRFSSTRSFFILPPWNKFRKFLVYIATNQYFDYFIILTILTNCIFLAMPNEPAAESAELVFLAIYTVEMILKIIARGFLINSYTYLRDAWNWLDFLVILSAYLTLILDYVTTGGNVGNLQGIRTFRVFRVLRTVSIVPGLKTIVNALLRAFRMLFEVMTLILFCLMVFALFGLQIYMGVLRQKCVSDPPAYNGTIAYSYAQYYNDHIKNSTNWYTDDEGNFLICGNASGSLQCPDNYTCLPDIGENPNFGYTGFDHFGWAMLTSFQLITLDFWEDSYNKILQSSGPWNIIFFIFVIFFGSFYLLNLMLAVVAMSYEQEAESAGKEKEKEARNKNRKKKKKKKLQQQQQQEKEAHEAKEKEALEAIGTANAVKAAVEIGYPAIHAKLATSSTARPLGNPSSQNNEGKDRKHVQRKPMVKMPSKDSGTGNSVESSRSNGSKEGDYLITEGESYTGSTMEMVSRNKAYNKKPLLKQASSGMVSSSGVTLTQERGSTENIAEDFDQELYEEQQSNDGQEQEVPHSKGREYIEGAYPGLVIIDVEENYDRKPTEKNQLINRNCNCCYDACGGRLFVPWLKVQTWFFLLASEPLFDLFITFCIVLNTVMLALEHHNMSETLTLTLEISNFIFTGIFTFEAVVKITAFTKHYFKTGWNIFDLVIVVASLADLQLSDINGLSVFRAFRLLRVFKLAQSWPTMKILLSIIMNTLGALGNLTLILCIVIYIFAVIGLQLFNKSYTSDVFGEEIPRWNFNDIFHSFMMIFRVLCGEWIEPLWDCMQAADELCMAVFIPTLILGYFIVLNLFLVLLLNAFASDSLKEVSEKEEENKLKVAFKRLKDLCMCCVKKTPRPNSVEPIDPETNEVHDSVEELSEKKNGISMKPMVLEGKDSNKKQSNGVKAKTNGTDSKQTDSAFDTKRDKISDFNKTLADSKNTENGDVENKDVPEEIAASDMEEKKKKYTGVRIYKIVSKPKKTKKSGMDKNQVGAIMPQSDNDGLELGDDASTIKKEKKEGDKEEEEKEREIEVHDCLPLALTHRCSCYFACDGKPIGEIWFKIRVFMNMVVEHKVFESIILFLIAASSISLAFEDVHLYSKPELQQALFYLNIIFAVLFTLEMLMKWIAFGLKKYFTNFWCILDFCIVAVSLASLIAEAYDAADFSAFRSLRTLRALRPLRAISRWQGMRIVVNALMMAIPSIINVLVVCVVFWLIFSIMGVQFFAGKFFKCVDADGNILDAKIVPDRAACDANSNYTWKNSKINFDHVGQGYLALFQVATFEGWMELMQDAVDSTEVDKQPSFESSLYAYLYFVAFIIFGAFFTLNLFIGVIIDNFNMLKKKYDGSYLDMFLTSGQRKYYNTIKKLGNKKPQKTIKRPKNKVQGIFYDISNSSKFEMCIVVVIFLNMITMAVSHYHQTDMVTDILNMLNILFVVVFALEAVVKIIGLRWHYFRMAWNVFDFIVVLLSLLGIIIEDIISNVIISPTLLRVVRVFRIGRVLRLIKAAKGIRKLLFALIISLPALFNIGMLLFLIMYIYAIICMSTFQNLRIGGVLDDDVVNFKTFINSFMLMFRLSTAAGWNDVLDQMLITGPPDCNPEYYVRPNGERVYEAPGDCGTPYMALIALTTYILIIFLVVINMFIAVILENFNQAHEQEEVGITEDDFDMFYAVWERYDPLATQFIKYEQLSNFVADLEPPLGISKPNEIALVSFDLPIVEGDKLHCLDVLMALVKYVLGNVEESPEFNQLHEQMEMRFQAAFPTRVNTCRTSSTMARKKEDVAAKTLQRAWRSWKAQKQMKNIAALAMQHQNQKKTVNVESRSKASSIRSLGNRLSTALSAFFTSSRPSSAISRLSVKSASPSTSETSNPKKRKGKVQSAIEVPKVSILYSPDKDQDIEL